MSLKFFCLFLTEKLGKKWRVYHINGGYCGIIWRIGSEVRKANLSELGLRMEV